MHRSLWFFAVLFLALLVQAIYNPPGTSSPPTDPQRSAETTVDVEEYLYSQLRQHNMINDPKLSLTIYVQKLQGRTLVKPVLKRKDAHGKIDFVAHARTAELTVLAAKRLLRIRMSQGVIQGQDDLLAEFENKDFLLDLPKDFAPK